MSASELPMWTVYNHPRDFPSQFVARKHFVGAAGTRATTEILKADDIASLRQMLAVQRLVPIQRDPSDDPVIMETWL